MKSMQLKSVVWKEGKYFVAQCLNVEVSSFGDTREEALKNLEEALSLYFEDNDEPEIHEVDSPELGIMTIK
jgi:predicted RNase H-like HicB family nuclease